MKKTISFLMFLFTFITYAQEVSMDKFINETQISYDDSDDLSLVWWIPIEFWEVSFSQDKSMSDADKEMFINTLKPYTIFGIVDGEMGPFGGVKYSNTNFILETLKVTNQDGVDFSPLTKEDLSPDVYNLLAMMKPALSNMMGALGENFHFYVFDDYNDAGKRMFDPLYKGVILTSYDDKQIKIITPIGSLLPEKTCPIDGDKMNGAWFFCPWHGEKLEEK